MESEEMLSKIREQKAKDKQDEFEEMYNKYSNQVKFLSGGIIETNKAEFIKMYAFYSEIIHPRMIEMGIMLLK